MNGRPPVEIDEALRALAPTLDVPPPPDYAALVLARLTEDARSGRPRRVRIPRLLVAAATVLLTTAVTVAVPASRHALASWFGFSGIDIRTATSSSSPLPPGPAPLTAGRRTTLRHAIVASADRLRVPAGVPAPGRVFVRPDDGATVVTLAYRTVTGLDPTPDTGFALIVTEIFDAGHPVMEKLLHTGARAASVEIDGRAGVFIEGPQEIINLERRMSHGMQVVHEVAPRSSANTLIWGDAAGTYRLEGDFTRARAIELANSFG